jgi:hypothetical protein
MPKAEASIAVIVVSCDNYSDLWPAFFFQFNRYWPECSYPVYLTSNHKTTTFPNVKNIAVGDDLSWSDNLLKALETVKEKYLLLFIEDLFLVAPVDQKHLNSVLHWAVTARPNHLRLNRSESPTHSVNNLVGKVCSGAPYRTSTVLSLWDKKVLSQLLKSGENAWQFEIVGSERSDAFDKFYTVHRNCFPVINTVVKGKWTRRAAKRLLAEGAPIELERRGIMSIFETFRLYWIELRSRLFKLLIPWWFRRSIRKIFMPRLE